MTAPATDGDADGARALGGKLKAAFRELPLFEPAAERCAYVQADGF